MRSLALPLLLSVLLACATPDADMLRKRLDASVGQPFEQTGFSKPTAAARTELVGNTSSREYKYTWLNGCSYVLTVSRDSGLVLGWRFVSPEALCQAVPHGPLGS